MSTQAGQTRYARNGEVDIAYQDLGGAGGDPLLLIMGLGVSRFWWPEGFVRALTDQGFHVVAYDQRDAGESTRFSAASGSPITAVLRSHSAAYSAEDMTDDAVAVLDALGWPSAHVVGASLGGQLAQRLALRHPDRVRSVTSVASLPSDVKGLAAVRYVHAGLVARLARMRFPDGRDGDIALGLALARAVASPGYPFDEAATRRRIERDVRSGVRDAAAPTRCCGPRPGGRRLPRSRARGWSSCRESGTICQPRSGRRSPPRCGRWRTGRTAEPAPGGRAALDLAPAEQADSGGERCGADGDGDTERRPEVRERMAGVDQAGGRTDERARQP